MAQMACFLHAPLGWGVERKGKGYIAVTVHKGNLAEAVKVLKKVLPSQSDLENMQKAETQSRHLRHAMTQMRLILRHQPEPGMLFIYRGLWGGGAAVRAAVENRRKKGSASRSMADNPPNPHYPVSGFLLDLLGQVCWPLEALAS
eukprot:1139186-Pelagomonas_calceolata.AAC.2